MTISPSLDKKYGYGWKADVLECLLDEIEENIEEKIDLDRVNVTGFSMGGQGTWDLGVHTPHRFSSLLPICGESVKNIQQASNIPQRIYHGDADTIVPISNSQQVTIFIHIYPFQLSSYIYISISRRLKDIRCTN